MKEKIIRLPFRKTISENGPCFIIAEAGVNHNGNLDLAIDLVDFAVKSGADAVKFQTFFTEEANLRNTPKAKYHIETTGSNKKLSLFDLIKSQELNFNTHKKLLNYCNSKKIIFISTPYDKKSVDLLAKLNVCLYKIASTDANNLELIKYICQKGKPIILSTGMCTSLDVDLAVATIKKYLKKNHYVLMQCTANYPAPILDANLLTINYFKKKYKCLSGYSDHVLGSFAGEIAVSLGSSVYEKHITLNKNMNGPDHRTSMNFKEFVELIKRIRLIEKIKGQELKFISKSESKNRNKLRKFIVTIKDINQNEILSTNNIQCKRTGGKGMEASSYIKILGKKIKVSLSKDQPLEKEYI